jgi:hypothetical protein
MLTCSDTCTCDVTCNDELSLFAQPACKGSETKVAFDGQCRDYGNLNFSSYRYAPDSAPNCIARGTSTAEVGLAETRTVCCK